MNKIVKKIIKSMPAADLDIEKNYESIRKIQNFLKKPRIKLLYKMWDYEIEVNNHKVPVRMFYPKEEGPHPIIVYYHGGGWVIGNIDTYARICHDLANATKHIILAIDYRLAPEYKFPIGFLDCYEVTKFIFKHANILNVKRSNITIMGDSAGANIAACVSLKARNNLSFLPQRQILLYPATVAIRTRDLYPSIKENKDNIFLSLNEVNDYIELYKNTDKDLKSPYFAPMNAKNLKNLPKTLIITAELDVLRDEAEDFGEKLKLAGNDVKVIRMPNAGHGFLSLYSSKTVKETHKIINEFLKGDDIK